MTASGFCTFLLNLYFAPRRRSEAKRMTASGLQYVAKPGKDARESAKRGWRPSRISCSLYAP